MASALEEDIHIPLPGITDPHRFENWTKCIMGLNITRKALRKPIEFGAKEHLLQMPKEEIYHFETFADCLKTAKVFHLAKPPKDEGNRGKGKGNFTWTCPHNLCWKIINTLLDYHVKSGELKRKWVIPKPFAIKVPNEEGKNVDVICDEYFWDIMKLYTYNETVKGNVNSDEIDKIELVLLLQILSNCTFPQFSNFHDSHEREMTNARNDVMHSGDSSFGDRDLAVFFFRMTDSLSIFRDQSKYCTKAISLLADLQTRELFRLAKKQDELTLVIGKALKTRNEAIEFDMETCVKRQELARLRYLLQTSRSQFQNFDAAEREARNEVDLLSRQLRKSEAQVQSLKQKLEKEREERDRRMGGWQGAGRSLDRWFQNQ